MKRPLIISITIILLFISAQVWAASITGSTTIGTSTYSPSAGVTVKLVSQPASYGATSKHVNSGTRQYGTVGGAATFTGSVTDPSKICWKDTAAGTDPDDPSATGGLSGFTCQ